MILNSFFCCGKKIKLEKNLKYKNREKYFDVIDRKNLKMLVEEEKCLRY